MRNPSLALALLALPLVAFGQMKPEEKAREMNELAALRKVQAKAKATYLKKPKDAKLKKAYVFETVRLGMRILYSPAMDHKTQSAQARPFFVEALKVDPTNADARKALNQIDMIDRLIKSKKKSG